MSMGTREIVALPGAEVSMVEPEIVRQMRLLHGTGWGAQRIAREVGVARNTVRIRSTSAGVASGAGCLIA